MTAGRLAQLYRLEDLAKAVERFCESEFVSLAGGEDWLQLGEAEVLRLLDSDGLVSSDVA